MSRRTHQIEFSCRKAWAGREVWCYVIELEDGCYYVGVSHTPDTRIAKHAAQNGRTLWTKAHKYVATHSLTLIGTYSGNKTDWPEFWALVKAVEKAKTLEKMAIHGCDKVRGGPWCKMTYLSAPQELQIIIA